MSLTYGERRTKKQKEYDELVLARVKLGMALLEKKHGPDWADKIDPKLLDLSDSANCVLGQLYGYYDDGAYELWGASCTPDQALARAEDHGFYDSKDEYDALQAAWDDVLTPRVSKGAT